MNYDTVNGTVTYIDKALTDLETLSIKIYSFLSTSVNDKTTLLNVVDNLKTVLKDAKENIILRAGEMKAIEEEVKRGG